jgi:hypothetical protein
MSRWKDGLGVWYGRAFGWRSVANGSATEERIFGMFGGDRQYAKSVAGARREE